MFSHKAVDAISLIWLLGWGLLLLKFPVQSYRFLALGRVPTLKQLKIARFVGYMGVFFGVLLLIEIAFGWVH